MLNMNIILSLILGILLIIICGAFITRYERALRKFIWMMLVPTFCAGLLVYLKGYWVGNEMKPSGSVILNALVPLLRAIFSAGRMFILENDLSDIDASLRQDPQFLLAFGMVHVTALILTTVAVVSWFGEKVMDRLKLLFKSLQTTYIIYGLNEESYQFARNLHCCEFKKGKKKKKRIIFIENDIRAHLHDKVKELGAIIFSSDPLEISCLDYPGIKGKLNKKTIYIFAFTEDEALNTSIALKAMREIKVRDIQNRLSIFVKTKTYEIGQVFDNENHRNETSLDVRVFNQADIAARQLVERYPLYNTVDIDYKEATVKSDQTILLVGFGNICRQIFLKTICCGQFVGSRTRFIVVDNNITKILGVFKNRYPELMSNYDISVVDADVKEDRFYDILRDNIHKLNYIVVALGQDSLNIDIALGIKMLIDRNLYGDEKQPTIAVNVWNKNELFRCNYSENKVSYKDLHIFGQSEMIFTEDVIINESLDIMAKAINTHYNKNNPQQAAEWEKLDSFTKESNRASAMHIRTKLKLAGLDMCEKVKYDGNQKIIDSVEEMQAYLGENRLNNIAHCEHLRWNAFHFASGWRVWRLEELGSAEKPKDINNKRHACMVGWKELKDVAYAFGKGNNDYYQRLDIEQVLHIPDIVKEAGYIIYINSDDFVPCYASLPKL